MSDTAAQQLLQNSSVLRLSSGLRPLRMAMSLLLPARRSSEAPGCVSRAHPAPRLWLRTRGGFGRRLLLSPSRSPAPPGPRRGCPRWLPRTGTNRSAPSRPRRFLAVAQRPAPFRCSAAFPAPLRSHGRAGHAAGRAGAGLRAAAGAGARGAAGGRPLPGAGRGREERSLPGPVRGAESHRAVRAGEEGPARGLWRGGVRGPGAGRAGAEGKERKGGQCRSRDPPALWWSQALFTRKEIVQPGV